MVMPGWQKFLLNVLKLPIKFLVKSKVIPQAPISELNLDLSRPILYVLPYHSIADLLAICNQCSRHGLPDPLASIQIDNYQLPSYVFINNGPRIFQYQTPKQESVTVFHHYLDLHLKDPQLDIQMLPVSVLFGRSPGREGKNGMPYLRLLNGIQKFFVVLWLGRDSFVRFSNTVSLRNMADKYGTDTVIAHKLARVARIHFSRQRLAIVGPRLPVKQTLFNQLLASTAIEKAIEDESKSKKIPLEKARQTAIAFLEEIAANFSYEAIRLSDRVLSWTWNRLYQGINVHHVERVRQLAQEGHELVYVPCHRSHMDYMLLSYVLYHQGLVPPHIAAGINLNFWPAGPIFRRLGAFFIRRTFKGNKLYSTVFREYLSELFTRGYSVEYFIEGGRSRTGHLLEPKTGTLSMTLQTMLRGCPRPITLIPVYIGYEHVIEVATYAKELRGATKKKENLLQVIRTMFKLPKLGQGYVNFGDPITLSTYLNQHQPNWREAIDPSEAQRPHWFPIIVNQLANQVMVNINSAAAINSINLCATALLASHQRAMTREQLLEQLDLYLQILRSVPYSSSISVPQQSAEQLLTHALSMGKFAVEQDDIGDIIVLPRDQAVLMAYYRNNTQHLFALPSLLATMTLCHRQITREELLGQVYTLYPMLKAELFIHYDRAQLTQTVDALLNTLSNRQMVLCNHDILTINPIHLRSLQLLAAGLKETLQRYAVTFSILASHSSIDRSTLEKESKIMAQRLSVLHGTNIPAFFDKAVFSTLVNTLRSEKYINENNNISADYVEQTSQLLSTLLSPDIRLTMDHATPTQHHPTTLQ